MKKKQVRKNEREHRIELFNSMLSHFDMVEYRLREVSGFSQEFFSIGHAKDALEDLMRGLDLFDKLLLQDGYNFDKILKEVNKRRKARKSK